MRGLSGFVKSWLDIVAIATLVLLATSFFLGGASRLHEFRLAIVEISALPLLVLALDRLMRDGLFNRHALAVGMCAGLLALPLMQLIPLPPAVWTGLPGRDESVLALELAGLAPGWTTLSFTPDRTWRSALALLPPIAMFLGVLVLKPEQRLRAVQIVLGLTALAIMLGALQLASGTTRFYLWQTTDATSVVGFFANRNHLATLCLVAVPFTCTLAGRALRRGTPQDRMTLWFSALMLAILVVAIAAIRSRAGIALFFPVLAVSLTVAWIGSGQGRPKPLLLGLFGGVIAVLTTVACFTVGPILARFDNTGTREGRFENWPVVAEAANSYLPAGSGIGSFDTVYRSVEPLSRLDATYFNQAHNDYLETWLEAGWPGAILLLVFFVWFSKRSWTAWQSTISTQRDLQRAATVAIGAILLHSAVDYPLRTAAIATLFALCCGLLEMASVAETDLHAERSRRRRSRHG